MVTAVDDKLVDATAKLRGKSLDGSLLQVRLADLE
ncbi:hypothetical protein ACP70R_003808 [Stipagrostis hirtigluma subsp. patula]